MRSNILLLMLPLLCAAGSAGAADWTLDSTFGGTVDGGSSGPGRVALPFDQATPFTDVAMKVLLQSDGKYVVIGSVSLAGGATTGIGLARFLPTGARDTSFATGGFRVKDACFITIRNATLDTLGRIVVVGDIAPLCTGNSTTDVGVVRFNTDGSDDTSFAGDGGIGFKFNTTLDGSDWGGAVVALPDNSLIVAGSVLSTSTRQAVMQKVSATGVVAATPPLFALVPAAFTTFVDGVLSPNGTSTWLSQRLTNNSGDAGAVKRVFNATLTNDTSFGTSGEQFITVAASSGYTACPGLHYATSLVRFGTTVKVFGYASVSEQAPRSWFASMRESNGGVRTYGCLDLGGSPVDFFAQSSVGSSDAGGSIYLSGRCGLAQNLCLWRTVKRDGTDLDLSVVDTSFNGGLPVSATFSFGAGGSAAGSGISVMRDGNKTVVAGTRRWLGDDLDFAVARFGDGASGGDPIFANGFE
jgi:uncharacterized delta-60 repeat protein